jgi:hypothetical protein
LPKRKKLRKGMAVSSCELNHFYDLCSKKGIHKKWAKLEHLCFVFLK